jgi:SAM-dependent methyltransferase
MDIRREPDAQAVRWNGAAGRNWVDAQALLDRVFKPFEDLLVDAAAERPGGPVLDVGCGTGATTVAIARALGAGARCAGIDISEPMLAAARARAEREGTPVEFIHGDAEAHPFESNGFGTIVSRFGVMFFDDPVSAFANLRRAASSDGRLIVIAWRSAADNPFMTTAERAAAPLLPDLPARRPDEPGQFAFADALRARSLLERSGWTGIAVEPIDVACSFPERELIPYVTRLGPVGLALRDADDAFRARVAEAVRPAFDPYVAGEDVRFTAACWMIGAHAR